MTKENFKYRLNYIISSIILWEILFYVVIGIVLYLFGLGGPVSGTNGLAFKNPKALWLLIILFFSGGIFILNKLNYNKTISAANQRLVSSMYQPVSSFKTFINYFLFRNGIAFIIIAIAQPVYGTKKVKGTSESLELVVTLDVSNSMNSRDISKDISRLDISKRALVQLVNNLHGEKIGICIFANSAFVQLPLTTDYVAAKLFIDEIQTNMISDQGTNIHQALEVSRQMFSEEKTTKGIILVTDGEDHEAKLDKTLEEIKEQNIQLSILGIGTLKGGLIPKKANRPELGYRTDSRGNTVISKLNKQFISELASKSNGFATISSNEFPNLSDLLTQISRMKRSKINTLEFDVKQEQYQIPLFVSLICFILFSLKLRTNRN